jgi:hypothetical protein
MHAAEHILRVLVQVKQVQIDAIWETGKPYGAIRLYAEHCIDFVTGKAVNPSHVFGLLVGEEF